MIFLGKSGAGKGTQAKLLQKYLEEKNPETKVLYVEVGNKFRSLAEKDSHTSRLLKDLMENGQLAPEFLPIWAWGSELIEKFSGEENIIFDGGARKLHEAQMLDDALSFYKMPIHVVLIDVSDEWATGRLLERGRSDDEKDDIKTRLAWFETDVMPVIDYFQNDTKNKCVFHKINGEQTIEGVHDSVVASLFK